MDYIKCIPFFVFDLNCMKSERIRSYSSPHFSAFVLNAEKYSVPLRIQSEYGKIKTNITPNTDDFSAMSYLSTSLFLLL